ncbi:hypothetical protein AK812_SmicGene11061 [Symbiodinium microadriaticum]|uniref:Uncharacterized protein n=1 Tax=Symbiodinium microadriaticum TaxID=2951 RepID=A0A1Q9EEA2_SYMMI|nr:hypothetical protein AK812_SmicGene11061 [Symbiodinium microadriaticum]
MRFCPLLENIGRPLSVTPQKLLALVVQYLSKSAPRLYEAVHLNGLHSRVVLQVHGELRRLEAKEGRRLLNKIRLKGDVELDATALRKVYVSSNNEGWAPLVEDNFSTRVFQLHIRCAGALQRNRPVLVVPLPPKLVVPGARPPTESLEDVYDSNLVSKLARGETQAFSDGNKAWRRVCQEAGIPFEDVVHRQLQFAKIFRKRKGVSLQRPASWVTQEELNAVAVRIHGMLDVLDTARLATYLAEKNVFAHKFLLRCAKI